MVIHTIWWWNVGRVGASGRWCVCSDAGRGGWEWGVGRRVRRVEEVVVRRVGVVRRWAGVFFRLAEVDDI